MILRIYDIHLICNNVNYLNFNNSFNNVLNESTIKYNSDGSFNRIQINDKFTKEKIYNLNKITKFSLKEHKDNVYKIIETNDNIVVDKKGIKEYIFSEYSKNLKYNKKVIKSILSKYIDKVIAYSNNKQYDKNRKNKHNKDAKYGFYKYNIIFSIINNQKEDIYSATLLVRNSEDEKKYLYDILNIKKIN